MHEKRIRHKDVKPHNILVHNGILIYTDFEYSLDSSDLTHSTTEGTPDSLTRRYSAPEVLLDDQRNSKLDVNSLGCVFIDMFSALTQLIEYGDSICFYNLTDRIPGHLDKIIIPKWSVLPSFIKSMTEHDRTERPTAGQRVTVLSVHETLHCAECGRRI
jgi:serine/threonine protein kinase